MALAHDAETAPARGSGAFSFDNSYARLPANFHARVNPTPVAYPRLIKVNHALAEFMGLDSAWLESPDGVQVLAGNRIAHGSEPLAMAYAGHQFGHFVPQLGDGRANLLGELRGRDGRGYDVQLKGSGRTPFSRGGDGRAALGPVLREYLVSEAMHALGVPTTRALAAVTTGEQVFRETPLPGAILTRVAASHLRVGSFQYFAARGDYDAVQTLADYAIARHYPEAVGADSRYLALLESVIARQAQLVARWMNLGFIHGVLNTDNTSISGETLDYGPCAFMEAYDPVQVFSSIDHQGRYAYANQPHAMQWNLCRLAETLLPLMARQQGSDEAALEVARAVLGRFLPQYEAARASGLRAKLGLSEEHAGDDALAQDLLDRMAEGRADFTLTFRRLCTAAQSSSADTHAGSLFADPSPYREWAARWRTRMACEASSTAERLTLMRSVNPVYIPRNHRIQAVIDAAVRIQDLRPFEELLSVLERPCEEQPGHEAYEQPAAESELVLATFCGT